MSLAGPGVSCLAGDASKKESNAGIFLVHRSILYVFLYCLSKGPVHVVMVRRAEWMAKKQRQEKGEAAA